MASLGLSVILSESALAFNIVKYLGAGYLIFLGVRSLLSKASVSARRGGNVKSSGRKIYLQGIMTNVLNPKVALFFLAFLPQFIDPDHSYGPLPFIILGFTFIFTGTIWCMILAVFSSYFAEKLNEKLRASNFLNRLSGIIFIALGLNLLRAKLAK
jgi:threonine/homoserine/homoserine lactone efflux protein